MSVIARSPVARSDFVDEALVAIVDSFRSISAWISCWFCVGFAGAYKALRPLQPPRNLLSRDGGSVGRLKGLYTETAIRRLFTNSAGLVEGARGWRASRGWPAFAPVCSSDQRVGRLTPNQLTEPTAPRRSIPPDDRFGTATCSLLEPTQAAARSLNRGRRGPMELDSTSIGHFPGASRGARMPPRRC